MLAPTIMIQGTASSVGKSLLVTGLCRLFARQGLSVAPFKAQNMALNSAVTKQGLEIGRAQAIQAEAAGTAACVDMNPILLKPEGERCSQVVVMGRSIGRYSAVDYHAHKLALRTVVAEALERLRRQYDLVIIEGAGSPAEINLRAHDLVNMHIARVAEAPVLLVGDIDRGGVFAALVGTLELLDPDDRARVAAFVINKFRGDRSLLQPGLDFLTERTRTPVLGVLPYVRNLRLADEDSMSLEHRPRPHAAADEIDIAVLRFPRISNHDDVESLEHEPGVVLRFVDQLCDLGRADLIILPGSKSTVADLAWLRQSGLEAELLKRMESGSWVLGICGGCQMLGEYIYDPQGIESTQPQVAGLGLLPLSTRFESEKTTAQVLAVAGADSFLTGGLTAHTVLSGYEIHMGEVTSTCAKGRQPAFVLSSRNGQACTLEDGAVSSSGAVVGTMIHGILENEAIRAGLIQRLRQHKGLNPQAPMRMRPSTKAEAYDRLASLLEAHFDLELLHRLTSSCRSTAYSPAHL